MLKKQTVWLLTMLSLVIVLTIYYLNSEPINQMALDNQNQETEKATEGEEETNLDGDVETETTEMARDDVFEAIRLQMMEERSAKKKSWKPWPVHLSYRQKK